MKKSKWLKWQIGAISALGIAIMFREVKDSPSFAMAAEQHGASIPENTRQLASNQDPVVKEFKNQQGASSTPSTQPTTRRRGHTTESFNNQRSSNGSKSGSINNGGSTSSDSSTSNGQRVGSQSSTTQQPIQRTQTRTRRS